jgi:hypothetical protein
MPARQKLFTFIRRKSIAITAEELILAGGYCVAGFVLIVLSYFVIHFFVASLVSSFLHHSRYAELTPPQELFAKAVVLLVFAAAFLQERKNLFKPPTAFRDLIFSDPRDEDAQVLSTALMSGPRCFALTWFFARHAMRVAKLDLDLCAAGLEVAMRKLRRVTQADLPNLDFATLLRELALLPGVVLLQRPPHGFVLTAELRQEIRAAVPGEFGREKREEERAGNEWHRFRPPAPEMEVSEINAAFQTLGLNSSASLAHAKAAYRKLAKMHHPDVASPLRRSEAEDRMKQINDAYDTLLEHFASGGG